MVWELRNDRPLYLQIVEIMQRQIVSGRLSPGSRLMSVRDLAAEAKVNPNTIQRAYAELERMGLVETRRNTGREVTMDTEIIRSGKAMLAKEYVSEFIRNMQNMGFSKEDIKMAITGHWKEENHG